MELNTRGFFFSLISLMLLLGLFFLAQPRAFESTIVLEQASQNRIVFTNAQIDNFERGYLGRAIESQTYLVLEALSEYRASQGGLYANRADLEEDFAEGLLNGTFDGGAFEVSDYLASAGLGDAQRDLLELLELYQNATIQNNNINFSFPEELDAYEVRLFQDEVTGPWQVGVEFSIPYNVSPGFVVYGGEIANWTLDRDVIVYTNIKGIRDPYLFVRSGGAIDARIEEFYTERWSRQVFVDFVENGSYFPYNRSMSLLGRFYDSLEYADCCGMLTTINETRYNANNSHLPTDSFDNVTFFDCGYYPSSAVTFACRRDGGQLLYAVRGLSDYTPDPPPPMGIANSDSAFPFTIGGRIGSELFNMTEGIDLYGVYDAVLP